MVTPAGSKVGATRYPGAWTEFLAHRLMEQAVVTRPATYKQTVRPDLRG